MLDARQSDMTQISAGQWDYIRQENLSAREAAAFIRQGIQVRTFREMLDRVCPGEVSEIALVMGLCAITSAQPDSIRRKVHNWMSGKSLPTEREDVFRISFALNLELEQAELLLNMLTDQGIHYRNRREAVYAYALRYHLGYTYAQMLMGQLPPGQSSASCREPLTASVRMEFEGVHAEEALFSFLARNQGRMGPQHNTAYAWFCKMLALLTGEAITEEEEYSMEYVAQTYLRMNMPLEKRTSGYTDIQKMIKKYWPGTRSIKAMKSRSEDVNRKTLLLLYLVSGGCWGEEYDELDESYIQPGEFLEAHCQRINTMLTECSMAPLDPRNVFDYLVLYCLRPEEDQFMSDRMAAMISELFPPTLS